MGKAETFYILVVDDEEGMREGTARALSKFVAHFDDLEVDVSYDVDKAPTGEDALEMMERRAPDLLLLDYKLPGISGLDVLGEVNRRGIDAVTIMITAYASLETAITATKQGAFDFLAKPFTPQEVRAAVRKATSQQLLVREARRLAEEKKRVRFELMTVLSHELKAPLNAVESYLQLMKTGVVTAQSATFERTVDRSLARIQGMRKLIFDLIDMTRIEAGQKVRNLEPLDAREVAAAAVETAEPKAAERGIEIHLTPEGKVPFVGDRTELDIIMGNLVSNAVKYNKDGGRVEVGLERRGDELVIEVSDTGIGLAENEIKKLFKDFVRIKNDKTRNIEGSGLGLSTLHKIAKLYDGHIDVKSAPDEGSTFTVTLTKAERTGART